jgi:hypothetical protein
VQDCPPEGHDAFDPLCYHPRDLDAHYFGEDRGVEKEKWKTFKKTWGSSGAAAGGRIGRKVDYRLGIVNDVAGLSCWGFRVGTEVS